jgi:hypothetical protein
MQHVEMPRSSPLQTRNEAESKAIPQRRTMKYDDASWHHGGDFPKDLPNEAGATHTGMFVAWAFASGLVGSIHLDEISEDLERLKSRQMTPGRFFMHACDGKFTDEDLDERGNAFARHYFDLTHGKYLQDYEATLGGNVPTLYHVADTWENFDLLKPVLDRRFSEWSRNHG